MLKKGWNPRSFIVFLLTMETFSLLGLFGLGAGDGAIVIVIVLLLFGGKKIPELMRGLGRGIREFQDAKNNVSTEIRKGMNEDPKENKE